MEVTMAALPGCSIPSLLLRIHDVVGVCQAPILDDQQDAWENLQGSPPGVPASWPPESAQSTVSGREARQALSEQAVLDLPFLNQVLHRSGHVFDGHLQVHSVLIEQIDGLNLESLERGFGYLLNVLWPKHDQDPGYVLLHSPFAEREVSNTFADC